VPQQAAPASCRLLTPAGQRTTLRRLRIGAHMISEATYARCCAIVVKLEESKAATVDDRVDALALAEVLRGYRELQQLYEERGRMLDEYGAAERGER
jgi:hypothetical protein